jgi:hypothetical protein
VAHLAQVVVEVVAAGSIIGLVEVVEATIVVVETMVLEEEVASTKMGRITILVAVAVAEEDTIEVVVVIVVLMITAVAEVDTGDVTRRTTKGEEKVVTLTMLVVMDKLHLRKDLRPMVGLLVIMEVTMHMFQILLCRLLIAMEVVQAHTRQAMVPHLQNLIVVVPQGAKGIYRLHMMVGMVVGPCPGVELLVVLRHLIIAAVAILVVQPLSQLQRLSSVMQIVTIHVIMQGFTSQTCLLMSLLRNYRSYLEELAWYNFPLSLYSNALSF